MHTQTHSHIREEPGIHSIGFILVYLPDFHKNESHNILREKSKHYYWKVDIEMFSFIMYIAEDIGIYEIDFALVDHY